MKGEMAEQVKALAVKPDYLRLIPGTHILYGEKLLQIIL